MYVQPRPSIHIFLISIFLIFATAANAEVKQGETKGFIYHVYTPSDYNLAQKYPLIIAFHWSTGRGTDMLERWQEPAEKKKYILACPDSANIQYWDTSEDKDVFRMISQIEEDYNIDSSRIYLMGFSGGGMFSYYLGLNNPDKFRAIAVFAGSLKRLGNNVHLSRNPEKQIPVFILHGNCDNVLDISESQYAKKQLEGLGYEVNFMELKGEQHNYPPHISWAIINWFEKVKLTR